MGERIVADVLIPGSRNAPGLMTVAGVLRAAPEVIESQGGPAEHFFFRVGSDPSLAGFFIDPKRFRGAHWDDERLVIDLVNDVKIVVQVAPD
jgi:hypothetical protein